MNKMTQMQSQIGKYFKKMNSGILVRVLTYDADVDGVRLRREDNNVIFRLSREDFIRDYIESVTSSQLVDGGARETFVTGGIREPNPLRFDLISYEMLDRLATHYANGAKKYAPRNWEKGLSIVRCFNSTINHLFKYARCRSLNIPMEEDHLAAAIWNITSIMTYEKRIERGWLSKKVDDWDVVGISPLPEDEIAPDWDKDVEGPQDIVRISDEL